MKNTLRLFGIGFMVNPAHHYGPNPEGYEYSKWGTYHRADHLAVGVDRSAGGTGYSEQYLRKMLPCSEKREPARKICFCFPPCSLHIPAAFGKTLIQHIYDSHFEGHEQVLQMQKDWELLEGRIPQRIFLRVKDRFTRQAENSREMVRCDQQLLLQKIHDSRRTGKRNLLIYANPFAG